MIYDDETSQYFHLQTKQASYLFRIHPTRELEHLYYGARLDEPIHVHDFLLDPPLTKGRATLLKKHESTVDLGTLRREFATYGKGDMREPMLHMETREGVRALDFSYVSHTIEKNLHFADMPQAKKHETLVILLEEPTFDVKVKLCYTVFYDHDTIVRNMIVLNGTRDDLIIDKALSMSIDFKPDDYSLITLDGAWLRERHIEKQPVRQGIFTIDSKSGVSGSKHNPFIALSKTNATQNHGDVYGFNLIYSGNFEANIERDAFHLTRVNMGINGFDFKWRLAKEETFVTPEVVLSYSSQGTNGLMRATHHFVKDVLTNDRKERPIVLNTWEASYFDINARQLKKIASRAAKLGIECVCLDDGWFGRRDDDTTSLGDWVEHPKKFKRGLRRIAHHIKRKGLRFGLWVEPEMVSEVSALYASHPEWAVGHPDVRVALGRNQRPLDLTNPDVLAYLETTLSTLFTRVMVDYVKWDMNRDISDAYSPTLPKEAQGKFHHLQVLGLYKLLSRLKQRHPNILFESCASGGSRFDLGMHYYMPQAWTSDNTDAFSRLAIQQGSALAYPLSTISNHVNDAVAHQTLRHVPIETRFNVASFGVLGYELNVRSLSSFDRHAMRRQIAFYKQHRMVFQYGDFYDLSLSKNRYRFMVVNDTKSLAVLLVAQGLNKPNPESETIQLVGLDENKTYRIESRVQYENLRTFGALIKHALPIALKAHGALFNALANRYRFKTETVLRTIKGATLMRAGFTPPHRFIGTGYHEAMRIHGDFGSRLYIIKEEVSHA